MREIKTKYGNFYVANPRRIKRTKEILTPVTVYIDDSEMIFVTEKCVDKWGSKRTQYSRYFRDLLKKEMKQKE